MDQSFIPVSGALGSLDLLQISQGGPVLHLRLNRAAKRNALSDTLVQQIQSAFVSLPADVRVVVLSAAGNHFCAGLDLSEMVERDIGAVLAMRCAIAMPWARPSPSATRY